MDRLGETLLAGMDPQLGNPAPLIVAIVFTVAVAAAAGRVTSPISASSSHGAKVTVLPAVTAPEVPRTMPPADQVSDVISRSVNVNVGVAVLPTWPRARTSSELDRFPVLSSSCRRDGTGQTG